MGLNFGVFALIETEEAAMCCCSYSIMFSLLDSPLWMSGKSLIPIDITIQVVRHLPCYFLI
jgi:hypothetical protein